VVSLTGNKNLIGQKAAVTDRNFLKTSLFFSSFCPLLFFVLLILSLHANQNARCIQPQRILLKNNCFVVTGNTHIYRQEKVQATMWRDQNLCNDYAHVLHYTAFIHNWATWFLISCGNCIKTRNQITKFLSTVSILSKQTREPNGVDGWGT